MKRKISKLLVLILCGVLLLVGCSQTSGKPSESASSDSGKQSGTDSGKQPETSETTEDIPQPDPNVKYELTYTGYWCGSDYQHENYVENMIEDALNIEIKVITSDTSETIDLLLASDQMPDCMWSDKSATWMYEQELVRTIPRKMVEYYSPTLIEYYERYPLIYEMILNHENEDEFKYLTGITFQFVNYYLPGDYYRYDWIENLGIDLGVEVEQVADRLYVAADGIELSKFIEIMDAFVNKDPDGNGKNDTVGVTAQNLLQGPFTSGYNFFAGINNVNGRAEQYYVLDEYKDYLKGFADLWAKGLIDPEIIKGDRTLSWDKVNKGVAGYWITSTNALNTWAKDRPPLTLFESDPNAKVLATPGIKPDGGEVRALTNASPAYGQFFVSKKVDDKKLAKILQFVDYTLFGDGDKDIHASLFYGEKGVDWKWDETGEMPIQINKLVSGENGTWSFGQFGQTEEVAKWTGEEPLFVAGAKYWSESENGIWMKWQHIPYKSDLSNQTDYAKISAEISGDLGSYVSNYRTKAIMGQIDIDATWEEYLKELDRLGYNKMMDELEKLEPLQDIIKRYGN